ncbi:hypothetical protein MKZ38_006444 [Zalerion maritima]|uniref:Beta-xylosidase n=1 Tax=Zalerion maritima TaxID=339359 RepID=A0AAD5WWT7_9PEZI|nr:hypothetical protein MKZ38_006444 [Zalerion maritima]
MSNLIDTPQHTLGTRRAANSKAFEEKLRQMALPLAPLVQLTTGKVHPSFPSTLVNFWLLTDWELESLAQFYHQRTPSPWMHQYPCPIEWSIDLSIEEKRRKIGKFIGLRGCDTPVGIKSEEEMGQEARKQRVAEDNEMMRRKMSHYY